MFGREEVLGGQSPRHSVADPVDLIRRACERDADPMSVLSFSALRKLWEEFYRTHAMTTKEESLQYAKKIDDLFGDQFYPPIR
jgi:hypothetical protein